MKIANVVTTSVVLALASLFASVGCSQPTSSPDSDSAAADSTKPAPSSAEAPDAPSSNGTSTPSPAPAPSASSNNASDAGTATSTATDSDPCDVCIAAKSPKMEANMQCQAKCQGTDCIESCWTTNCGTDASNECTQAEAACASTCEADTQTCDACITKLNPKAGAYFACLVACDGAPAECSAQCMTSSGCAADDACLTALVSDTCDALCSQ